MHLLRTCLLGDPHRGVYPRERGTVRVVARGTGADREDLATVGLVERKFVLEHLGIRTGLCFLANSGIRIIQASQLPTTILGI